MILAAMYFALGLFTAVLMVIFALPRIWRRAERLTARRIEAELPVTWSEIQAEKDRIRADYAVETRKAEMARDALRAKSLEQSLTLKERQDELNAAHKQIVILEETISDFEDRLEDARNTSLVKEDQVNRLSADLKDIRRSKDSSDTKQREKSQQLDAAQKDYHESKLKIAALETELTTLTSKYEQVKTQQSADSIKQASLETELALAKDSAKRGDERQVVLQAEIDELASRLASRDEKITELETRKPSIPAATETPPELHELEDRLRTSEMRRLEAEARLAALTLRSSNLLVDDDQELDAITALEKDRLQLTERLEGAEAKQKSLEDVIADLKSKPTAKTAVSRAVKTQEEVLTRINDIAAHVIRIAAAQDSTSEKTQLTDKISELSRNRPSGTGSRRGLKTLTDTILSK
ncbi:hypothetical protein [Coralliovum pocilloporae]|uniref:hypothetical protein n=1 Tax=Coralliovum pocilloporae TaxID=3066369 RepID=UPI0033071E94